MALASLVSFQEQKQKHKSDELAKARIFLKEKAHDSQDSRKSNFVKSKSGFSERGISEFSLCHS